MKLLKHFLQLIKSSLILDVKFLKVSKWSLKKKIIFLFKKYRLQFLIITGSRRFKLGESFVDLFGRKFFYDTPFGLAGYQSMLTRLQNMMNIAKMKEIKTVVDVGANVGQFSMMINDRFPLAQIYVIEPVPKTLMALRKNLGDNPNVKILTKAISDFNGTNKIEFNEQNSLTSRFIGDLGTLLEKIDVETQTLDSFIEENNIDIIDVLKIDVETYEKKVLAGGASALEKTHYIFIEISIDGNNNYTFCELTGLLFSNNYNFQLVAFRNYSDLGEGKMPVGDFLFENVMFKGAR